MRADSAGAPAMLFSLRRVARIALGIGAGAACVPAVTVFFLGDRSGACYDELIRSRSLNQQLLGPALAIGGLVLVAFSTALTWGIALYSSFRVAGPLFRLTRNLETAVARGPADLFQSAPRTACTPKPTCSSRRCSKSPPITGPSTPRSPAP